MHTRASNSKLVKLLSEPQLTVNRRLRRQNRRVPFKRRDKRPAQPRIFYLPILDINYFLHILDILENYNPMDDEPMWVADRVVAPTPGFAITIPKITNEFAINGDHLTLVKGNQFDVGGIFLYKTPNQAYQLLEDKVLLKLDWAKKQKPKSSLKKTVAFTNEGSSNSDTDKIMARMDAMTMKMDVQYKEMQSRSNHSIPEYDGDDKPIGRNDYNRDKYRSNSDDKPDLQRLSEFIKAQQSTKSFVKDTFMDLKTKLETTTKNHQASIQNLEAKFYRFPDKQSARSSGSLPSNTQPNPKGSSSKQYQPPQARDEHANVIFTWSVMMKKKNLHPNQKSQTQKLIKETPIPKPYKPKIPYPQCLQKQKMEAQYGKFLDMIRVVRINVPLVDVVAGMLNCGKFLKELISNKHKLEQISSAFLSNKSSAMIQNKVPPTLEDPESFLIPCTFSKAFSCNALADLCASINLMPYSLYAKLSLETLKPTKMRVIS
ncbi:hypothetical protein Tco_0895356 [Tanacetum coccineum]|uniref:Reverse transcriptase domain-containing protein n=1 Tax=Tanacetum coccineum TaxID=301880 RepID=A0ABQ5CKK1_9ASTR